MTSEDPDCTSCEGSGVDSQTERYCTCDFGRELEHGARREPVPFNCPFCDECLWVEGAGWEHPHSETCPLDQLYIELRHVAVWNSVARKAGTNG